MSHFGPPVSATASNDPLFRMRAYQIAKDLLQTAWVDAKTLSADPVVTRQSSILRVRLLFSILNQSAISNALGPKP
jgi:hypothetical protein